MEPEGRPSGRPFFCAVGLPGPGRRSTEPPVHITDRGIAPVVTGAIRASADGGGSFSDPLEIATAHKPKRDARNWGDVTGGPFRTAHKEG